MINHPFNIKLDSKETVGTLVMRPLMLANVLPRVVDVGARSGFFEFPESFTTKAEFVGFEPNLAEYEKLVSQTTDSILAGGNNANFLSRKYYPTAIWSDDSDRDLNITIGPGACTLSGDVNKAITKNMYQENRQDIDFHDRHQQVLRREKVKCSRLDALLRADEVIDYLKIDVEGGELDVLMGAEKLLSSKSILFIKTEFLLTPYYENKVLLGHQHVYLDQMGYRLIDFDFSHLRYLRKPSNIPAEVDRRPRCAGDAFFMLDPDLLELEPMHRHRLGVILLLFGFSSLAISMFKDAKLISEIEINKLEAILSIVPLHKKLKTLWSNMPYKIWPYLKKIGLFRVA